ncbi:MAG: aminotransferase class I/II-fold pyridoxal phosphate-dependent enzyme [Candidatus Micrarchaeaceae archaeon]
MCDGIAAISGEMFVSEASKFAASPIREDDSIAAQLIKAGKKVIKLNTGDPAKYFSTPSYIINAYIKALKSNRTFYSDSQGIPELREAVSKRHKRLYGTDVDPSRIVITQGLSEALYFINTALIDRGDSAVIIRPYYPSYLPYLNIVGGTASFADYDEDKGWSIDTDALERVVKKARRLKYMLITNPNNPTGGVLEKGTLEEIVEIAKNHDLFLISDEIYDELIFGGNFASVSEVANGIPHMVLNGASKNLDATGFRIGYMLLPEEDEKSTEFLKKIVDLARMRLSANTPAQYAVAEGINNENRHSKSVRELRDEIKQRVLFVTREVNKSEYMQAVEPHGAFYVFPKIRLDALRLKDDKEFVSRLLLEEYVQLTRGSGFGSPGHIRIVALPEKEVLGEAVARIEEFCKRHAR